MSTFTINEVRFWEEIKKLEDARDEHSYTSAEYIELDSQIKAILKIVRTLKNKD
jgi:hypothetical protein